MGMNFDSGELLAIKQVAFLLILSGFCLFWVFSVFLEMGFG
jgi:hypothetical protein